MLWTSLFSRPADFAEGETAEDWFLQIATTLLTASRLVVAGQPHRLIEVETYDFSPRHPDPFAHRDPVQQHVGRWYFHRTGGSYRGGSFKGFDLAFGDAESYSGVLFRGLEKPDGQIVDGPSLLVDHLLRQTGTASVRELDEQIADRLAWDTISPIHLVAISAERDREVFRSARVGLTLKRERVRGQEFLEKEYRYLTEPARTKKGRLKLLRSLLAMGLNEDEIYAKLLQTKQRRLRDETRISRPSKRPDKHGT